MILELINRRMEARQTKNKYEYEYPGPRTLTAVRVSRCLGLTLTYKTPKAEIIEGELLP